MLEVTNEAFETALADANNARIISKVCGRFRGKLPKDELTYRGQMALFYCLRKHDSTNKNKFTTSLYWHTMRQCQNAVRAERKQQQFTPLPSDTELVDVSLDVMCVRECVKMLPDECRDILINYFFDGMTLEEIGKANGYTHVAASRRLTKAKEAFRRLYNGV